MEADLKMEGYLIKISKGRWATVNNRRFFALRVKGQFLVYYEKEPSEMNHIPKKVIPTQTILKVQRGRGKETKIFYVHFKTNVMKLKANNRQIRDQWVRVLGKALAKQKEMLKEEEQISSERINEDAVQDRLSSRSAKR